MSDEPRRSTRFRRWPLIVVAVCSLLLVAARIIWPSLNFDSTSLALFGAAALGLLVAFLPFKRFKFGDWEAELERGVDDLEKKVAASEIAPPMPTSKEVRHPLLSREPTGSVVPRSKVREEFLSVVGSNTSNVEKVLAAGILLDGAVESMASLLSLELSRGGRATRNLIERFAQEGLIGAEDVSAYRAFKEVRNMVVHRGHRPSDEQTARLLDLVWRLLLTFG